MPEPEKVDASSLPLATGMQQQSYKSLLNQQVQKLRKQAPVYQTHNEGSEHEPKFRTTIWVDGVTYTSPNTFQQRKLAEIDASKITLLAILQKLKKEALHHVLEDKTFCKSILMDYAVKMDIQRPTYQTTPLSSSAPLFCSCLVFNGDSFTGDNCRTKKEAEWSAARAAILKYLDSETGIMLSEIIKSKFNHSLTKEIQLPQNVVNVPVSLNEVKSDEESKIPHTDPLHITTTTTTAAMNPSVDITQTHTQETPSIQSIQTPTQTIQTPAVVVGSTTTYSNVTPPTQTVSMPTDMAQTTPISGTNVTHAIQASNNNNNNNSVVQPIKSPVTVASSLPISTGKKRKSKNKKNAQKRMRAENQLSVSAMFHGQVATFSAQ